MSFTFEADFGVRKLTAYGINITKKESERGMCHEFSVKGENKDGNRSIKVVPGKYITTEWLFGPASNMDRSVIYSCSRYRCQLPCPCITCQHLSFLNVEEQFQDHQKFHIAFHTSCMFCKQLIQIFPRFNFIFMNREKQKSILGTVYFCPKKESESFDHETRERKKERNKDNKCDECSLKFVSRKEMERHVKSVHYLEIHQCDLCSESFTRKDNMLRHKVKKHESEHDAAYEFNCGQCSSKFSRKDNFERHLMSSSNPDGTFKNHCRICDESFCSLKLLRDHSKTFHTKLSCDECGDKFTLKKSLDLHSINKTVVSCDDCGKVMCNQFSLNRHKNNVHNSVVCEECGHVYKKIYIQHHKLWNHKHKKC